MASIDSSDDSFDMELIDSSDTDTIQPLQNDVSSEVRLIIHNQFPSIELTSPVYVGRHATCHLSPDQRVDAGCAIQASFNIDSDRRWSTGVLMYKLQRKTTVQSNGDVISNEKKTTCIQLAIIWKVKDSKEFLTASYLLEHNEDCVWDRVKLKRLVKHYKLANIQHGTIENTWLMHDNTVLMTSLNVSHEEECYKLEMTISKGSIKDDTQRPRYIDVDV
jgi:hypothetical protein